MAGVVMHSVRYMHEDTLRWLFGRGEHAVRYLQG